MYQALQKRAHSFFDGISIHNPSMKDHISRQMTATASAKGIGARRTNGNETANITPDDKNGIPSTPVLFMSGCSNIMAVKAARPKNRTLNMVCICPAYVGKTPTSISTTEVMDRLIPPRRPSL